MMWIFAGVVTAIGMIAHSASLFAHFELTPDFANFYQATWLIAHGHLYPYDTIFPMANPHQGFYYLDSHAEFFTWLLAPFVAIAPNGFVLLVLQDLAIAASQVVAALWIHHLLRRFNPLLEVALVGVFVFLDPWYYFAAFFDFHLEPFAMLFLLGTAWSYLNGRRRLAMIFALLVLSTGDVPSTYLVGLGIGMYLLDRSHHRSALLIAILGALNAFVDSFLHLAQASSVLGTYAYLAGPSTPTSLFGILVGIATHPGILVQTLIHHVPLVAPYIVSGNPFGLLNPMGLFTAAAVLGGPLLVKSESFLLNFASFQLVAFEPILTVAGASSLLWLTLRIGGWKRNLLNAALVVSLAGAALVAYPNLLAAKDFNNSVTQPTADTLDVVLPRIPSSAEVITGNGTVGRFADHRLTYPLITFQNASVPILSHQIYVIVVAGQGIADPSPAEASVIGGFLTHDHLHAETILRQGSVSVYLIHSTTTGYNLVFPANA
jgi:uncharacterized membrane protein